MARLQFEQKIELYKFRVPSLPSKTEFNLLKDKLRKHPDLHLGERIEVNYLPAIVINFVLLVSAIVLVLMVSGSFEIQDPILNIAVIIILILVVLVLGATGIAFNMINRARAQNFPNKYYKGLKKMVLDSRSYNDFVKLYAEKYYKGVSPRDLRDEIAYVNRNEGGN